MRFNEFKKDGSTLAVRTINRYADEIGSDSMDYDMFKKSAELLDKQMLKSLAQHIEKSDTAPREYVMKTIADHDPETFKKMYGDQEGYLSIMKPMKNLTDAEDNTDRGMNKYGLAARHKDGKFHSFRHGKHTGSFDSAEELAKHQQELIKDESAVQEDNMRDLAIHDIEAQLGKINDEITFLQIDQKDKESALAALGELRSVLDKYQSQKESAVQEDAPFDGMGLVRMALMRKFITVEEWDLLKHKWKDAAAEVEEKYSDWPEGEGFGSSDHNFAIRDLMTAVGYEFDDQDTSGRFVITKQPEEIEKAGIKNARLKGQPVAQEDAGEKIANMAQNMTKDEFMSHADELGLTPEEAAEHYEKMQGGAYAGNEELNRITKLAGLGEGASMMPYYKDPKDEKQMTWTFPNAWAKDEPLDTPYMSNASMRQFLDTLGYNPDFEDNQPPVPAKEFIARTTQWLQKNIDKPSPEEPTTVDRSGGGATMYSGGREEGYMNQVVKAHNELARKIVAKYPEVTHFGFN
jgi:hypothetical protein